MLRDRREDVGGRDVIPFGSDWERLALNLGELWWTVDTCFLSHVLACFFVVSLYIWINLIRYPLAGLEGYTYGGSR